MRSAARAYFSEAFVICALLFAAMIHSKLLVVELLGWIFERQQ